MKNNVLALCGALAGGALGYFAFFWIARQGFYAAILPGALLGLGASVIRARSRWVAVVCGLSAIALGVWTEYRFAPFVADEAFPYFLSHLFSLKPLTLIMIAAGGLIAFWLPFSNARRGKSLNADGNQ